MALWRDDPKLQREVDRALRKAGVPLLDFASVINAIDACPSQDWSDDETRAGNIQDIVKTAKRAARKKGELLERQPAVSREYAPSGIGQSYATMSNMLESLQAVRMKYWRTEAPPFKRDANGFDEAARWFHSQQDSDEANNPDGLPGKITLTLEASVRDLGEAMDAETTSMRRHCATTEEGLPRFSAGGRLSMMKDLIAYLEEPDRGIIEPLGFSPKNNRIDLRGVIPNHLNPMVVALPGETLGELLLDVRSLMDRAVWWSEKDALKALLYGSTPSAAVRVGHNRKFGDGTDTVQITLEVGAPSTVEEVARKYTEELEYLGLHPEPLTNQQNALLQLVAKYPEAS